MNSEFYRKILKSLLLVFAAFFFLAVLFPFTVKSTHAEQSTEEDDSDPGITIETSYWFQRVKVEIDVREDKTFAVKETLTVGFLHDNYNTGIIRDIQRISQTTRIVGGKNKTGKAFLANISDVSVTINGGEAKVTQGLYSSGQFHSIKMQKPDKSYFPKTDQSDPDRVEENCNVFVLSYIYDMSDDRVSGFDDFTFDLLGYAMAYTRYFSARITFPTELRASQISVRTNKKQTWVPDRENGERIDVQGNTVNIYAKPFEADRGYTLQALFPEGYFDTEGTTFFSYYIAFAVLALAGIVAGIVVFTLYCARRPVEQVEFYPPEGMRAMRFSSVWHPGAHTGDVGAVIMQWAHEGCVHLIKDGEKDLIVWKLKDLPDTVPEEERNYFNAMFPAGNWRGSDEFSTKQMRSRQYPERARKLSSLVQTLKDKSDIPSPLRKGNLSAHVLFTLFALIPFLAALVYTCILNASPVPIFFFIFIAAGTGVGSMQARQRLTPLIYIFPVAFTAMPLFALCSFLYFPLYDYAGLLWIALAWWAVSIVLVHFLKRRSEEAQKEYGKMRGFRRFLLTAELSRIEMLFDDNPGYYSEIIPYCLIMGISKKVAKRFEALHVAAPAWAEGIPVRSFSSFSRALSSSSGGGSGGGGGGHGGSSGGGGGGGGSRGC